MKDNTHVSFKITRILHGILIVIFLFMIRIGHLAIFKHEEKVIASLKPQKRVALVKADRATIYDRFGTPLATNKIQYNTSICYGEIREIPKVVWKLDDSGKKVKVMRRVEYIKELANLLGEELNLDPERIEDLIHGKASLIGKVPFVIKENISEKEYFRLKMLEKDWPGLNVEKCAKRFYPFGAIGADVIGYLGPINRYEYEAIAIEMNKLSQVVAKYDEEDGSLPKGYQSIEQVCARLEELEKKAYTINDYVGKAGVEKSYEEALRGHSGKKCFLSDIKGNYLREMPGSIEPKSGHRLYLTISKELQEFAEKILLENESAPQNGEHFPENGVWIKGGAIVALDPNTGEVLALASTPRFDPNDFIRHKDDLENLKKNASVQRWLEQDSYIGAIWDGKEVLKRERVNSKDLVYEESMELNWNNFLSCVLDKDSAVKKGLKKIKNIKEAKAFQERMERILACFKGDVFLHPTKVIDALYPQDFQINERLTLVESEAIEKTLSEKKEEIALLKRELAPYFSPLSANYDKLLLVDLSKVVVNGSSFPNELLAYVGEYSLEFYRDLTLKILPLQEGLKGIIREIFHEHDFKKWREEHFKEYLAQKRKEEKKERKKYARPYIEFLDEVETSLFVPFFEKYKYFFLSFFLSKEKVAFEGELTPYLVTLQKRREELDQGGHLRVSWSKNYNDIQKLAIKLEPQHFSAFLQTMRSYDDLRNELLGKYHFLRDEKGKQLEKHLAGAFYPKYGYGYLSSFAFGQSAPLGSIFKLVPAYEAMKQRFTLNLPLNPLTIIDDKHKTGVGYTMDHLEIPLVYKGGRVPRSDHPHVGVVDLVRALETSSNPYFALLAGDVLEDPQDLPKAARLFSYGRKTGIDLPGETAGWVPSDVVYNRSGLYATAIGQHSLRGTPLQTAIMFSAIANGGKILKPKVVLSEVVESHLEKKETEILRQIFLPPPIRTMLLKGLQQVIFGEGGTARGLKKEFSPSLLKCIVGKTSTPEAMERLTLDGVAKCKPVGFAAIYFNPDDKEYAKPELVVVVYLRYGDWGWKAAPYAVRMIEKFLEIKKNKS